ncbi:hypothetical protein Fmac_016345 [Flemingia macrophylla]|uniref:Nudix hydrolase domain-containing protein n=1 Tax=Flemingia macrophylla TaxID=520843 RepID=A0ABD1MHV1_9FABA
MMCFVYLNLKLPHKTALVISKASSTRFICAIVLLFVEHLRGFDDVFVFPKHKHNGGPYSDFVSLHPMLKTSEERTSAVGYVVERLGEEQIPGIRSELYPVTSSFGAPIFFSLERAAAPYFGIKVYGVQMNGYVELNEQKHLWIGKRSDQKTTYPGMLDELVAGGLPHGIDCQQNLAKECEEEAGIPTSISINAIPVGAVSYNDIDEYRYKRDVLFCYDLKLPKDFIPKNEDGEVDSFKLIPVTEVAEVICKTEFFKPNCALVIIDFLFRHGRLSQSIQDGFGISRLCECVLLETIYCNYTVDKVKYITPEYHGYLDLLRSLRIGDCS